MFVIFSAPMSGTGMKIKITIIAFIWLLAGQAILAQVPAQLQAALEKDSARDDLSGWIYDQLQWVAKAPASRWSLLVRATEKAWRRPHTNEEVQAWLDLLTNKGYTLLLNGSIVPSTDAYSAAYDWARQHPDITDEDLVLETILKPLGNNYTRLGDYEQALFIHRKALALATVNPDKQVLAGVYGNLANTSSNMGRPQSSLDYCRQGLEVVDPHSALSGLLLSEQADAAQQLKDVDLAQKSIGKSIAILENALVRRENPAAGYWLLMAYQQAGDIYTDRPREALGYYRRALGLQSRLEQRQEGTRRRERAKLFLRLGSLFARTGEVGQAIDWLDKCLEVLAPGKTTASLKESDLYAENTLVDVLYIRAGLSRRQKNTEEALRLYGLSFAAESKLRQELISNSSREQSIADTRSRYEEAIGFTWETWKRTQEKKYLSVLLRFMESSKAQLLLEEVQMQQRYQLSRPGDSVTTRIRLLERALAYYEKEALQADKNDSVNANQERQISWELAQLRKKATGADGVSGTGEVPGTGRTPRAGEVSGTGGVPRAGGLKDEVPVMDEQVVLEKGQAARSFFCGSAAIYTLECTSTGISFAEKLPLPASWQDSLRIYIHTWFEQGANAMIDRPLTYYRQAYAVYRDLFGLHPFQAGASYILLMDGALNLLPVEALVTEPEVRPSPVDWPFVLDRALISYGWSLQTLREQGPTAGGKGFSGFFLSGNLRSSPILKAIETEQSDLQKIIPIGSWYTNEQATTGAFRKAMASSAVLHISSHAFAKKDSLDMPHIELFDAPFYLFELKGLDYRPALVVLGACRTGDGRMVTGEGAQSLARAFTGGGAKAVIAGWWNVNDETAASLIKGFYAQLIVQQDSSGVKINAARALRAAKLNWLKDPAVPYLNKLPYYWAALNYQGNPQPLREETFQGAGRRRISGYWWLSIPVLLIISVLYRVRRSYMLP
ncbi:MAG TPA: CHAT domain-containing tetratricopeptide repeat protein [Puia sp.]|nr:CHAT domain-containing tetratricopeptide repeat protein [Puia sp.]